MTSFLYRKIIIKVLIRWHSCAGWSVPLLLACINQVFSHQKYGLDSMDTQISEEISQHTRFMYVKKILSGTQSVKQLGSRSDQSPKLLTMVISKRQKERVKREMLFEC